MVSPAGWNIPIPTAVTSNTHGDILRTECRPKGLSAHRRQPRQRNRAAVEVRLEIVAVVGSARTGLGFVQQRRTLPEISEPGPFPCFPLLASTFRRLFNETLSIGLQSAPYSSSATTAEGRCCRLAINCLASAWFGIWRRISSKIVSASAHFCWFAIGTARRADHADSRAPSRRSTRSAARPEPPACDAPASRIGVSCALRSASPPLCSLPVHGINPPTSNLFFQLQILRRDLRDHRPQPRSLGFLPRLPIVLARRALGVLLQC